MSEFKDISIRELIADGFNVDLPIRICEGIPGGISQMLLTLDPRENQAAFIQQREGLISINLPKKEEDS